MLIANLRQYFSLLIISILLSSTAFTIAQVELLEEVFEYDRDHPAVGYWLGNVELTDGVKAFTALTVKHEAAADDTDLSGSYNASITLLIARLLDTACTGCTAKGSELEIEFKISEGLARMSGSLSEDGQYYTGTAIRIIDGKAAEEEPGTFKLKRYVKPMSIGRNLAFTGKMTVQGMEMGLTVVIAETAGGNWVGHLDIPMQNLKEYPLVNIKVQATEGSSIESIAALMPIPGGAEIEGEFDEAKSKLTGVFKQSGYELAFELARDENYVYAGLKRPQTPVPPYPYTEMEVIAKHPDGFSLAGTLTIPGEAEYGKGPFPVAVLISGSGQQDRNESLLGHKPFLVIADYLTRHGIAVMRYDDRGVGDSSGLDTLASVTSADFATDTLAVVNQLKTLDITDKEHIGLIGHSEGGLIAPMVGQLSDDIDFMILLAGPGVVGKDLLIKQSQLLQIAAGSDESKVVQQTELNDRLLQAVIDGETEDVIKPLLAELIRMQIEAGGGTNVSDQDIENSLAQSLGQLSNPWMRYFLAYDPAPALQKTSCPVLALNGTKDTQVWHKQNLDAIQRVMTEAGGDITIIRYDNLNHLFQPCDTGAFAEYINIETTFSEKVMADMVKWINKITGRNVTQFELK